MNSAPIPPGNNITGQVTTVLGAVDANQLGITLCHEHIFLDLSCWWCHPRSEERLSIINASVKELDREVLVGDPYHNRDNLLLDDADVAEKELGLFKSRGGTTVVDLSTRSIGPYPQRLRDISLKTGLNIIAGTGFYVKRAHPEEVSDLGVDELANQMIADLVDGMCGTDIRAGIIGELGTSAPIHVDEAKVLRAAAIAHQVTGAPINIHLTIFASEGNNVLDLLENCGVDSQYVALSHLDERTDLPYHLSLAKRGCFIEFDCFGSECRFDEDEVKEPTDAERIESLLHLLDAGFEKQILLSQDICTKMQLREFGGNGYDHILRTIVPELKNRGVTDSTIANLLVNNPAKFLSGRQVSSAAAPGTKASAGLQPTSEFSLS